MVSREFCHVGRQLGNAALQAEAKVTAGDGALVAGTLVGFDPERVGWLVG